MNVDRIKPHAILSVLLALAILSAGCQTVVSPPTVAGQWFRGNTHTHTVLCGHADSSPETVAAWYHDRGYHFLILSEHNKFIDPATVALPEPRRDDFILIPGEEVTIPREIHTTAINIERLVPWEFKHPTRSTVIQQAVDATRAAGGETILNHPTYRAAPSSAADMLPVDHLYMFELFNGHPGVNNYGDAKHPSTEVLWDEMLSAGKLIYGVSSDDAHHFATIAPDKSNPGRGWVMVRAATLDPDTITAAMLQGEFYASNGVFLKTCERGPRRYVVEVDADQTRQELETNQRLRGRFVESGTEGYRIEFIGPAGKVLKSSRGQGGSYRVSSDTAYVRAKVTFTRRKPQADQLEEYYAWGQPLFTDGRAERVVPAAADTTSPAKETTD